MKFAKSLVCWVIKLALIIGGSASFLKGLVLLFAFIFSHPPYFTIGKTTLGFSGFMHGYSLTSTNYHSQQNRTVMNLDNKGKLEGHEGQSSSDSIGLHFSQLNQQASTIAGEDFEKHTVYVQPHNRWETLMVILPHLISSFAIVICCIFLFTVIGSIQKDEPFLRENPKKVMVLGITILSAEILLYLAGLWQKTTAPAAFGLPPNFPDSPFNIQWFLTGFLVLALAMAFSNGRYLKKLKKSV